MAPPQQAGTAMPAAVGWSASAFVAAVLARLIRKGLELLAELDEAAAGHLRRLEGLLPSLWRVLDAADAGAVDVGARPVQDLLDAAYAADDVLDDIECALLGGAQDGERGKGAEACGSAAPVGRKPRSPLRFLLCFSPPRSAVASTGSAHGKSSKAKIGSVNLDGLRDALEIMAQAAYRCTSISEDVAPQKNYATIVSGQTEDAAGEAEQDVYASDDVFGREAEVEQMLEMMRFSDDPHYRLGIGVLPITGNAGVGKTALVQFIFHHEVVRAEFPVRMWVHVSDTLQPRRQIMDQMVHEVAGLDREIDDVGELLLKELTGKRFLLVLDDVTDVVDTQWGDLMEVLKPAARRSLIIVTTQSETVATAIGTMPTLTLGLLGFDDYWKMFKHFAFGGAEETNECTLLGDDWDDVQEEELSPMEQIALELAKKMAGHPLPARVIGRALYFRQEDEDHWRNVLEDKLWEHRDVGGISPALLLSYRHLDPRLKQCFAYCAVFPGDYVFKKEELVQMWIAQGLLYSDHAAARLEDVGGEFFDELVKRCFFQPIGKNRYVMHNSMQELAREVATSRFFMITDSSRDVPQEVRHLTIRTSNLSKLKRDLALLISPNPDHHFLYRIRTILFFGDFSNSDEILEDLPEIFTRMKSVRVLGLSCINITDLPAEIGLLRHLRYLNLSRNRVTDLPGTLCQLYLLQVLDVHRNSPLLHPPNGIASLIHLRHLYASESFLSSIQDIQSLSNLQELHAFRVGGSSPIGALRRITQLQGKLRIGDLRQVEVSEVSKGILKGMQHLNALQLSWSSCNGHGKEISKDEEVLECLQPHDNLRDLRIMGYGGIKSPSWLMKTSSFLSNATKMYLTDCMNWKNIPPLHVLPSLEVLEIRNMHSVSKVSTVPQRPDQDLFLKLKRLVFEGAPHCTEWSTGNSKSRNMTFPCLCELEIKNCPKLTTFPDLPLSLTVLITENVGLESLPRIHDKKPSTEETLEATSKEGRWTSRLTTLQVHQCHKLRSLDSGLLQQQHLLKSLEFLSIKNCDSVMCDIPDGFKDLTALRDISLYDCPKMLVDQFHTSVRTVEINECFVAQGAWVEDHPFLFSVWKLKITGCSHASNYQESRIKPMDWLSCLFNVNHLHLENTMLLRLGMFDQLPSLEILEIDGCDTFFADLSYFAWLEKLQILSITNCRELCGLPENLCALPGLEELCVQNCPAMDALPTNGLPTSLKRLSISNCCPRLIERCLDDELDRPKIAFIGVVYIDGQCIQPK
ncbi:putative disease resistance protein RGA1 [Phragmites australis]|uniref:putative disease resistance protein RGA1 n=1 Tax=Phragmites australis TaxID=29695 RepID=UPI002D786498|nr:putative disease resistance protein RGA1 [Phragmites australis]